MSEQFDMRTPWILKELGGEFLDIRDAAGDHVFAGDIDERGKAQFRRIVACVNLLPGFDTKKAEQMVSDGYRVVSVQQIEDDEIRVTFISQLRS